MNSDPSSLARPDAMGRPAGALALALPLALVLAWRLARRRRDPAARARQAQAAEFPYIAQFLPTPAEMFAVLQREEHPEARRGAEGQKAVVYRRAEDFRRADALALHYTERLQAAAPEGGWPSLAQTWKSIRGSALGGAAASPPSFERAVLVRRALARRTRAPHDTHPALALYVVRRYCRRAARRPHLCAALDLGPGWGSQAVAACAAGLGAYNAFLLQTHSLGGELTDALRALLAAHRPVVAEPSDYWVSQMDFAQCSPRPDTYDLIFLGARDLVPLTTPWALLEALRPGGWIVLFVPPGERGQRAGQRALDLTQAWPAPASYRVRGEAGAAHGAASLAAPSLSASHALVWHKFE